MIQIKNFFFIYSHFFSKLSYDLWVDLDFWQANYESKNETALYIIILVFLK